MLLFFVCLFVFKHSNPRCSPWLESDTAVAVSLLSLYTKLTANLHDKFKGKDVISVVKSVSKKLIGFSFSLLLQIHVQISATTNLLYYFESDRLLPGQKGALWLHLTQYCKSCTSPKMPEYLLYNYHTEYSQLPWKDLYPDETLMSQFFNVRSLHVLHTHVSTFRVC